MSDVLMLPLHTLVVQWRSINSSNCVNNHFFFCDSRWQLTIANSIIKFWEFSRKCKNKRLEILKFNWLWLMMLNIIWKIKFTMVKYEITYWFPGGMKKFSGFIFIFQHNWEFVAYSYFSDIPTISWTFY